MTTFAQNERYLSPVLTRATDIVAVSGQGSYLTAADGRRYVDWVQGIAVNALGHCHPRVVRAVTEQATRLLTASFNLVGYEPTGELARRIAEIAPGDLESTFFSNSGAEAVDAAVKLARAATGRPAIIAFTGSFHGRTIGATSVTGSSARYRSPYEPLAGGVYFSRFPAQAQCPPGMDEHERSELALGDLRRLFDHVVEPSSVAAVIMEPVQGEGGYVVPPREFVRALRTLCDEHGILLVLDEIQSGYGRTGTMFASEHFDVAPDVMTIGKAMAGGLPMSAVVAAPELMERWRIGTHGSTFGGNPVAAAAGLAVLDVFAEDDVLANCRAQGAYVRARLEEIASETAIVSQVRGLGLMLALELSGADGTGGPDLVRRVRTDCRDNGLLALACGVHHEVLRLAMPLNVTTDVVDEGLAILQAALKRADED